MHPDLRDRIALVTGASSGVGRAIALALAGAGATVGLVGRRLDPLREVAVAAAPGAARCYAADLTEDEQVHALTEHLRADFAGLDVLVHAAGVHLPGQLDTAPVADFDRQYRTNVRSAYLLTQGLLPLLIAREGQLVFVNSSAGVSARAGVGQYAATKHALRAVADSLREEVNPAGVRVLSLFLGRTATPLQAELHRQEGRPYQPERLLQPEDVAAVTLCVLALPRTAEVTEISIRPRRRPA